jgi:hypothetical protein
LFNEETSHVGAYFDLRGVKTVVDLNKPYGTTWDSRYWFSKYNVVWECDIPLSEEEELLVYLESAEYAVLRPYDIKGYYYGLWRGLLNKFLGIDLPDENVWAENTGSMCQEILVPLIQSAPFENRKIRIHLHNLTAKTPDMTMNILKEATKNHHDIEWVFNG